MTIHPKPALKGRATASDGITASRYAPAAAADVLLRRRLNATKAMKNNARKTTTGTSPWGFSTKRTAPSTSCTIPYRRVTFQWDMPFSFARIWYRCLRWASSRFSLSLHRMKRVVSTSA